MTGSAMRGRDVALPLLVIAVWGVNLAVIKVGLVNLFGAPLFARLSWQT